MHIERYFLDREKTRKFEEALNQAEEFDRKRGRESKQKQPSIHFFPPRIPVHIESQFYQEL